MKYEGINRDFKSELQEYTQKIFGITSTYKLIDSTGPDHEKEFTMAVFVRWYGSGNAWGQMKIVYLTDDSYPDGISTNFTTQNAR